MEENKENNSKDRVKFNFGASFLEMLSRMIETASNYRSAGNYSQWLAQLQSIKCKITKMSQDDRDMFEAYEIKASKYWMSTEPYKLNDIQKKQNNIKKGIVAKILDEYDFQLMKILDKLGYLVPGEDDRSNAFGQKGGDDDTIR